MKKISHHEINLKQILNYFLQLKFRLFVNNKEFFSTQIEQVVKNITDAEYREAKVYIENMDTIYFEMSQKEQNIYNRSLEIIKDYFLQQTK